MSLTSNTIGSPAGDISIEFVAGGADDTFEIIDIGSIGFKFDIQDTTENTISDLSILMSGVTVEALNDINNSTSTIDSFIDSEPRDLDLNIGPYTFPLRTQTDSFKTDSYGDYITFTAYPSDNRDSIGSLVTNNVFDNDSGTSFACATTIDAFEAYLHSFGESTFIIDTPNWSETFSSNPGQEFWVIDTTNATSSYRGMQNLARVEGAIWGSGFNRGFYVYRESTNNKVTITDNDIIDVSHKRINRSIGNVEIKFDNTGTNYSNGFFDVTDISNGVGRQDFSTDATIPSIVRCFYDGTDGRFESRGDAASAADASAVSIDGIAAYQNALGRSAPFTISITVYGFDTIKPWEPFNIMDSSGKLGLFTNNTFRPSSTEHDPIENTTKITAYAIA